MGTIDDTGKAVGLNALAGVALRMALHTGDPGAGAASELSGGGYARQACSFSPAVAGVAALAATLTYSVSAVTITWVSLWDVSGSTRYGKAQLASPAVFSTPGTFQLTAADIDLNA